MNCLTTSSYEYSVRLWLFSTPHELASEQLFYMVTGRDCTEVCLIKRRLVECKDRKITSG